MRISRNIRRIISALAGDLPAKKLSEDFLFNLHDTISVEKVGAKNSVTLMVVRRERCILDNNSFERYSLSKDRGSEPVLWLTRDEAGHLMVWEPKAGPTNALFEKFIEVPVYGAETSSVERSRLIATQEDGSTIHSTVVVSLRGDHALREEFVNAPTRRYTMYLAKEIEGANLRTFRYAIPAPH